MPTARCIICTDPCGSFVCGTCSCLRSFSDEDLNEVERGIIREGVSELFAVADKVARFRKKLEDKRDEENTNGGAEK